MSNEQAMPRILEATDQAISEAVSVIKQGGLVAIPTETVYGLAADAADGQAVARIYEAKGRPSFNPLISHYASAGEAFKDVVANDVARKLAHHFWPGPLTMILSKSKDTRIADIVTAGLDSAAVRVPSHPVALKFLSEVGVPIAAPSANASGEISPTTPAHVVQSLGDNVALMLAAGACEVGLESTVIDLLGDAPVVVRPGAITVEDIEAVLGGSVQSDFDVKSAIDKPRSPGQTLRHYAPSIPLRLKAIDVAQDEALLSFGSIKFMAVKGGGAAKDLPDHQHLSLSETGDLHEAAANLFKMMRALDKSEFTSIAVMDVPETGLGVAINERLRRAALG
jgi:L-threonylcarbamoyladenylate synthase